MSLGAWSVTGWLAGWLLSGWLGGVSTSQKGGVGRGREGWGGQNINNKIRASENRINLNIAINRLIYAID